MSQANQADFFGEGVASGPAAPKPRATSPDGLVYLDTGEYTPLYYNRQRAAQTAPGAPVQQYYDPTSQIDPATTRNGGTPGTYARRGGPLAASGGGVPASGIPVGPKTVVSLDPAGNYEARNTPGFSINGTTLSPGDPSQWTAGQRLATQGEADRANAYYSASGSSTPPGGHGAPGSAPADVAAANAAAAQAQFNGMAAQRGTQAQDMFAQGAAAQGRVAPQAAAVNYGPAQTVRSTQAGPVDYGKAQTVAPSQQAQMGSFGSQQSINAPTLASAQQAAMGNFGSQQSVQAGQIGGFQQAQAQQASATSAANQAGFLAGTAQQARNIADLNFGQSDQSRGEQQVSLDRLRGFVDQGPGASVAQAQLRQTQEQNLGAALSLARSGRGNAAGNMKMAISENAATNAQTNQQAALLRAQEATDWRGQQLQAYGMEQGATQGIRQQDLGAAVAQGQQAISREQIASNVDVSRAGLEQGLAQFNAGAQNQASLTNAQLGTQASTTNANNSAQAAIQQAGYTTDANISQASLANALNVARGQSGTQVNLQNAEQQNLTSRMQGQLQFDASSQTAQLANARNVAMGQAGTNVSMTNADNASQQAITTAQLANQLGIAQGDSRTTLGVTNANNATQASMTQAELANQLAVASGNSLTDINTTNATNSVRQNEANDALQQALYGYGMDAGRQQIDATKYGADNAYDYTSLGAEIDWRNLDRAAGIKTADKDRKQKEDAALMGGIGAGVEQGLKIFLPWMQPKNEK